MRGEVIDVFPAESDSEALRIELFDGEVEKITLFDPLTGETMRNMQRFTVYPKTHYATTRERVLAAVETIKVELKERLEQLYAENKLVEAQRLAQRTQFDIEMMAEVGFCNGIENYSRHLTGKNAGEPPPTLFDYLPPDALLVIDESHVTIPQIGAMFRAIARARRPWSSSDSACRRHWTTDRCVSKNGRRAARARSTCPPRRARMSTARPATRSPSWWCARLA